MKNHHLVIMVVGCLLPLAVLAAMFLFKLSVNPVLLYGLVLLCPISHLFMMGHDHGDDPQTVHAHAETTRRS
jgi:hypothetical protein